MGGADEKKTVKGKSFRLFDFSVCDGAAVDEEEEEEEEDNEEEELPRKKRFHIQMFGLNERGETCSITIPDFQPFFFVKGLAQADVLLQFLRDKLGRLKAPSIVKAEVVHRQKLYGFTGGKTFPFVKLTFQTLAAMNQTKRLWYDGPTRKPLRYKNVVLELYESHIPPLLRFFHLHNLSPSGWFFLRIDGHIVVPRDKTTTCTYEYVAPLANLVPQPDKEVRVPYKICSFDIEASSSHGDFPLPVKTYKRLVTNLLDMSVRLQRPLDGQLVKRVILTAFGFDQLDHVDRVFPKQPVERELIKATWASLQSRRSLDHPAVDEIKGSILEIDRAFQRVQQQQAAAEEEEEAAAEAVGAQAQKATFLEVLNHPKLARDVKLQMLNDALTRAFPLLEGDRVTYIGSTFVRYGDPEPYLQHCLVVGACDPVSGVTMQHAATERDLLLQWRTVMLREDPDIIIGYNIFGFDWEFLFRRSQETGCADEFLTLSRNVGENGAPYDYHHRKRQLENTKIVLATGEYDLRYPKLTGRLQIDLYTYFRRDFNLASYKLDDVASSNICDDIVAVVPHETTTELFTRNLTGLHVGDFIHLERVSFTTDYYQGGRKFPVLELRLGPTANVIVVAGRVADLDAHVTKLKWGKAKDDLTPQDLFRLSAGTEKERALVAKYCVQDCNLVHHLMAKLDVMTGYAEMARICSVPISFLIFRGQGIKLTSFVAKKCREKKTLMPDLRDNNNHDDEDGGYEGAIVLPPKCAMYMDNPVACVDYSSLYPSSMISQNYSHDSKVWTKEFDLTGALVKETGERSQEGGVYLYDNLPGVEYIDITFDVFASRRKTPTSRPEKVRVGRKVCRWAQCPEKSIMPSILEELLQARKKTRKAAAQETDPFMANILDKRQLGYKVTANSLYGQCGARTSTFFEQDVAAATTATGRAMIMYAKHMVEEVYGNRIVATEHAGTVLCKAEYVYGDTDSVFFTFNLEDPATGSKIRGAPALAITIELAQKVAQLCTQFLKPPMELSYEKTLLPFILLSKKRYVGMLYETDPKKGKLKYMGLSLKRRDSCDYLKDVYGGILNLLMDSDVDQAIAFLDAALEALIRGEVPMEKLTITKALRSDYKNPLQIGHWVLAERMGQRDPGNKPKPGDRMRFVFVEGTGKMGDRIETPEYVVAHHLKVDYAHYITNQLMKPLQQLFGLALQTIWERRGKLLAIRTFLRDMAEVERESGGDLEVFMKKKEKYCAEKIKTLLFEKHLVKISNDQQRLQSILTFFKP